MKFYQMIMSSVAALSLTTAIQAQSISINSPAQNAQFNVGDTVNINVVGQNGVIGWNFVSVSGPSLNQTFTFPTANLDDTFSRNFNYVVPANVAGTTITITANASSKIGGNVAPQTRNIVIRALDAAAPTYAGAAGVVSALRVNSTGMQVTWNAASDNVTLSSNIVYNIYYSTTQANVFTEGVKTTFTGTTSGFVSGLTPASTYFVGVRAKDEQNNTETNTTTVAQTLPASADAAWNLYE